MPHFGDVIQTDDDLWKNIAWIRTNGSTVAPL
jgi:hypothetical protein